MADRRITSNSRCAIETRADGGKTLVGYGAVFYRANDPGTEYQLWSDLYERVSRSAFDAALKRKDDARGLFNHDPNAILGRTTSGTMRLSVDDVGLRYEIDLPNTQQAQAVAEAVARGDVSGSSFSFRVEKQTFEKDAKRNAEIRTIEQVELFDVGPVTFPAYAATTSAMRSDGDGAEARQARDEWRRQADAEAVRVRLRVLSLDTFGQVP